MGWGVQGRPWPLPLLLFLAAPAALSGLDASVRDDPLIVLWLVSVHVLWGWGRAGGRARANPGCGLAGFFLFQTITRVSLCIEVFLWQALSGPPTGQRQASSLIPPQCPATPRCATLGSTATAALPSRPARPAPPRTEGVPAAPAVWTTPCCCPTQSQAGTESRRGCYCLSTQTRGE